MKTFILKISAFLSVILLLLSATFITSCKKDKTTHGTVTVANDTISFRSVANAKVVLTAPSGNGQKTNSYTSYTDGSGVAKFDISLPAIWDVTVTTRPDTLFGVGVGAGLLRLDEPGKKEEIKVIVY